MLLHTSRTMDGPWVKTVPVASCIFDVSSCTGTCWKGELGNDTLIIEAQNMHQLRVFGSFRFANGSFSILFKGHPLSCQWQEIEVLLFNPSEPRGRRYVKNMGHNRNRLYSRAIHASMEKHYVQWFLLKSVYDITVVSHIFDVFSSTGLGIEGYHTCWNRGLSDLLGRWIRKS